MSHLTARILDQLSLSSWLPSSLLVLIGVLLYEVRSNAGSFEDALRQMASPTVPQMLAFAGAVAVTTVLAQAFEFEAIRLLEGYWGAGPVGRLAASLGGGLQRGRRRLLVRRCDSARKKVAKSGGRHLRRSNPELADLFEDRHTLKFAIQPSSDAIAVDLATLDWKDVASPSKVAATFHLASSLEKFYPVHGYDVLPTRLGNVLKSHELRAKELDPAGFDEDIEGLVHRSFGRWPNHLREEHDSFRGRLNVYCTLVLVFVASSLGSALIWRFDGTSGSPVYPLVFLVLAWLSYRAAVASALGYGRVLVEGARLIERENADRQRSGTYGQLRLAV